MKLTDTQRTILTAAAQHPEHLAYPPERLPSAPRQAVAKALLKNDLVIAVHRPAYDAVALWTVDGDSVLLKITDEGLRAIGHEPEPAAAPAAADTARTGGEPPAPQGEDAAAPEAAQGAPTPAPRANLRDAAQRVLDTWDDEENQRHGLADAMDALRQILAKPARAAREPGAPRKPREGTKQEQVLALLRREEGATIAQICRGDGLAAAHGPRLLRRSEEAPGHRGRGAGAGAPGWAEQGGRPGLVYGLPRGGVAPRTSRHLNRRREVSFPAHLTRDENESRLACRSTLSSQGTSES